MGLHLEGHFVTRDAGGEAGVVGARGEVFGVEIFERVEEAALRGFAHVGGAFEVEDGFAGGAEDGALIARGHVAAGPVFRAADGAAGGVEHDDEAGEVFVDAAEAVVDPRAEAGAAGLHFAGVHLEHRGAVDGRIGDHGVDERDVIDAGAEVGEEIADELAALAVGLEGPLGSDDAAFVLFAAAAEGFHGNSFAVEFVEFGLVLEGIDLAGAAVHEEKDDALGFGFEMRLLGREGIAEGRSGRGGGGGGEEVVEGEQAGHGEAGEAGAGFAEEFAAGAVAEVSGGRGVRGVHG